MHPGLQKVATAGLLSESSQLRDHGFESHGFDSHGFESHGFDSYGFDCLLDGL